MLELNEILEIIDKVNNSNLNTFELEHGSLKLKLQKGTSNQSVASTKSVEPKSEPVLHVPVAPVAEKVELTQVVEKTSVDENLYIVKSPMVGTFYASSSPDSGPFVNIGDKVSANSTVCIIEAMKLFNEIEAEQDGTIVEILVKNGQLVEFGQPLFKIKVV
jgi:acetyl-CoA carboxylase biotin carboxyl carrier protein